MTILHVIAGPGFGGSEKLVLDLCKAQRAHGHRVVAAVRGSSHLERLMPEHGIDVAPIPLRRPLTIPRLAKWSRLQGVDVLHSHLTSGAFAAFAVSAVTGIPVVTHVHVYTKDINYRLAVRRGPLIAVSDSVRKHLIQKAGAQADRVVTIRNGVDIGRAVPTLGEREAARRSVAAELGVAPDARFVTLAARITPQKGQDVLLRAAAAILERVPTAQFLLPGLVEDRAYAQQLREQIVRTGLEGTVHLLGLRHDVPRLLIASDAATVPSRYEPFGLSVIEPMALGTPVIASRVGGVVEIVNSPDVGALVSPESPNELAQAIIKTLADRDFAQQVGKNARARVEDRFSTDRMLQQIDTVYERITESRVGSTSYGISAR